MKGLIVELHSPHSKGHPSGGPPSGGPPPRGPRSYGLVVTKLSGKKENLKVFGAYGGGNFHEGDWINFTDLVEKDRGIKRQVFIQRDPDFPWVQKEFHNWKSVVKLVGRLFINRIVHQEGSTQYFEDWILGPVAISVEDCPDWTDTLLVTVTASESGRQIPGSKFFSWWRVVQSTPLQPSPVFLEAQMQRENERRNPLQNLAAVGNGGNDGNENDQNNGGLQNDALEELNDGGHREENIIENLNEKLVEDGEQEDGNIVEDSLDLEPSDENEEDDDLPKVAAPPFIAVNKNLEQEQASIQIGEKRNPGEQLWLGYNKETFLIFALLFLLVSLLTNIFVRLYIIYF